MPTSRDRILTTHVGSLPRNDTITELLIKREAGEAVDGKTMADELDGAVAEVVQRQKDAGIDIGNDGEQQRVAFQTYMAARMSGYGGESKRRVGKDFVEHPDLVATFGRRFVHLWSAAGFVALSNRSEEPGGQEVQILVSYGCSTFVVSD